MRENKLITFLLCIICVLLVIIGAELCIEHEENKADDFVYGGTRWTGKQDLESGKQSSYIAIPGFYEMTFIASQKNQRVNIYNPETNQCFMLDAIILDDGTIIWESDALYPGYGFYNIELIDTVGRGSYDAHLVIRCFNIETGKEVNGSTVDFKLYVK